MKKRKIILGALLALTTTFILASCNNDNNSNTNSSENVSTTTPSDNTVPSTTDNSTTNESSTDTTTSQETTTETIISYEELQTYLDNREEAPYNFGIEKSKKEDGSYTYNFSKIEDGVIKCPWIEGHPVFDGYYTSDDYKNIEFETWDYLQSHAYQVALYLVYSDVNNMPQMEQQEDGSYIVTGGPNGEQYKNTIKKIGDGFAFITEFDETHYQAVYCDKYFYAYKMETNYMENRNIDIEWITIDLSTLKQANN